MNTTLAKEIHGVDTHSGQVLLLDPRGVTDPGLGGSLGEYGLAMTSVPDAGAALVHLLRVETAAVVLYWGEHTEMNWGLLIGMRRIAPGTAFIVVAEETPEELKSGSEHVHACLQHPASSRSVVDAVRSALDYKREISGELDFLKIADGRLHYRLEWFLWKQKARERNRALAHGALIKNLKHSLSQGLGPGALVTMVEMLPFQGSHNQGGDFVVPRAVLDGLSRTADSSHSWFERMDQIMNAFKKEYTLEEIKGDEFAAIFHDAARTVEKFRAVKNQSLAIEPLACAGRISGETKSLGLVFRELLVNAFKYSPEGSRINVTRLLTRDRLTLVLINDILPMRGGVTGVPGHLENTIFEPFYRLNNVYDERYCDEELSMGTGLTVVQNTLAQMGGHIQVCEILDHCLSENPCRRVVAMVSLPYTAADSL